MIPVLERKVQLIGISGHSGTGKNTIANYITQNYTNTYEIAFADPLKFACAELFGLDIHEFYDTDKKEDNNKVWGISPRKIAQFIGTEMFRDRIAQLIPWVEQDFWVHRMAGTINARLILAERDEDGNRMRPEFDLTDTIIVPDVRFQNEYNFIAANGGLIINVERAGCEGNIGLTNHASESGFRRTIDDANWTIINNGTVEELYNGVDKALEYTVNKFNYSVLKYEE